MKKKLMIFLFAVLSSVSTFAQHSGEKKYLSIWEGDLKINAISLKLVAKIFQNENGSLGVHLDSPNQGAKNIEGNFAKVTDDSLIFKIDVIGGKYSGKINKENMTTEGEWKQAGTTFPLSLKKVEKATELNRPQTPAKPYPYNEEEVEFYNTTDNIKLAGSFTFPKEGEKFPAVILVTGSGKQDRDETLLGHKPFLVIADYLTRNGIAVLRYDDRGAGKSTGNFSACTSEDFARDAITAVEYLKSRKEVKKNSIGIIGHSEGGLIAPMVANSSADVNFIVLLAGPAVNGRDLLVLQEELILRSMGTDENEIKKQLESSTKAYDIVLNEPDSAKAYSLLKQMYFEDVAKLSDEEKLKPEYSEARFEQGARQILSKWFRFFIRYNPQPALENITIPVLALNGDKDTQVSSKQNLPVIEESLKNAENKNYKIVELKNHNHIFQHAQTGAVSEYSNIEETFSEEALKIMAEWINQISKGN